MAKTIPTYMTIYFGLLFGVFTASVEAQVRFLDARTAEIQQVMDTHVGGAYAGAVIGIIDTYGTRTLCAGKMVDGNSIFEIGSVTKVFTSILLMDAVRRGEMQLNDQVNKYLPEGVKAPARDKKGITLLHLAAHESGLPFNPVFPEGGNLDTYSVENLYRFLKDHTLTSVPGAEFSYSNVGYALLGHALSRKTGSSYKSLVTERIFRPLKMDSTSINLNPRLRNRLTNGHLPDGKAVSHINLKVMVSAGGIYTNANDMLKFLAAVLGLKPTPLSAAIEKTFAIRHRDQPTFGNTAIPWFDRDAYHPPGTEILCHGGATRGYRAFLGIDRKKRRGIVILTNQTAIEPHFFGLTLLQGLPLSLHNMTHVIRENVGLGIGLDMDAQTGNLYITMVFPDSAAGKAQVVIGSIIKQINGVSVKGKTGQECLGMMAGPAGTTVQLKLIHPETKKISTVKLTKRKYLNYLE